MFYYTLNTIFWIKRSKKNNFHTAVAKIKCSDLKLEKLVEIQNFFFIVNIPANNLE